MRDVADSRIVSDISDELGKVDCCEKDVEELIDDSKIAEISRRIIRLLLKDPFKTLQLADMLRRESCGEIVTFVVNRNVNFTDLCINRCRFCSFRNSRKFVLDEDEIRRKVREAVEFGCTEVCLQGGLMPDAGVDYYVSLLKAVRKESRDLHIHAFSPMEVFHAARNSGCDVEDVLREFKKAGLNSMPGTAAEIFSSHVRREICPEKITGREWFEVVKLAHGLGIPTTATMMYGHVESWEDRIAHMLLLRKLQLETGGFTEFIPLTFLWRNNELGKRAKGCSGFEDLLVIAVSRIVLGDVIRNVQASWVKLGIKLAQAALYTGANDLGGTLMEENISKAAGSVSGECLSVDEFVELIKRCDRIPAQRDTLYRVLRVF